MDPFLLFELQLQVEILTSLIEYIFLFSSTQHDLAFSLKHTGRLPCFLPPYLKAGWSRGKVAVSQLQLRVTSVLSKDFAFFRNDDPVPVRSQQLIR